jgi:hypothetical protein
MTGFASVSISNKLLRKLRKAKERERERGIFSSWETHRETHTDEQFASTAIVFMAKSRSPLDRNSTEKRE